MLTKMSSSPKFQPTQDSPVLSDRDFRQLQAVIRKLSGIHMSESKFTLVASRVIRRLRALNMKGFAEYLEYLSDEPPESEWQDLVNCVTTNKTEFFREPHHFRILRSRVLIPRKAAHPTSQSRRLRIWSAACSGGHEPYTIAMTLSETLGSLLSWDVRILASDIDTDVLKIAESGYYPEDQIADIPKELRLRYCQKVTVSGQTRYRMSDEVKSLIAFRRINLNETPWPIRTKFHVIFCRNVMIYFDRPTQQQLLRRFYDFLEPGGLLFLGHSENIFGMEAYYSSLGETVYQRKAH